MAITIKAYGIQLLIYTNSQQILSHFSQRIQYKRNKFPVGRVSKNHQRSHWNEKKNYRIVKFQIIIDILELTAQKCN